MTSSYAHSESRHQSGCTLTPIGNCVPQCVSHLSNLTRSRPHGMHHLSPITLISSVQTLRIHTLSLPSTPSMPSSSMPSHQHRRAGLRQNSSSFCAMPIALLPTSLPRMSLRSRASARLQMTALFGSPARWPQWSSWLKPLRFVSLAASYAVLDRWRVHTQP